MGVFGCGCGLVVGACVFWRVCGGVGVVVSDAHACCRLFLCFCFVVLVLLSWFCLLVCLVVCLFVLLITACVPGGGVLWRKEWLVLVWGCFCLCVSRWVVGVGWCAWLFGWCVVVWVVGVLLRVACLLGVLVRSRVGVGLRVFVLSGVSGCVSGWRVWLACLGVGLRLLVRSRPGVVGRVFLLLLVVCSLFGSLSGSVPVFGVWWWVCGVWWCVWPGVVVCSVRCACVWWWLVFFGVVAVGAWCGWGEGFWVVFFFCWLRAWVWFVV